MPIRSGTHRSQNSDYTGPKANRVGAERAVFRLVKEIQCHIRLFPHNRRINGTRNQVSLGS